jgi:hypothetical protein
LREGVKPDGLVVVVDSDRPVKQHGMPPVQLRCESPRLVWSRFGSAFLRGAMSI